MIIKPSNEYLFITHFLHDIILLALSTKDTDFRMSFKCYAIRDVDLSKEGCTLMICQIRPRTMCYLF